MRSDLQELLGLDEVDDVPEVTLYVSSNYNTNRYAIVDEVHETTWHAQLSTLPRFQRAQLSRLPLATRAQFEAHVAVARKAVTIAAKKKKNVAAPEIRLTLYTEAQWLRHAGNGNDEREHLARQLHQYAQTHNVALVVQHVSPMANPAHRHLIAHEKARQDQKAQMLLLE